MPLPEKALMLGYVLGPFWGIKAATLVYFIIGWLGAYAYAGLWVKAPLQRALAAALFIGNGFFICRLGAGHVDFIPFLILPLVLWIVHQSSVWQSEARNLPGMLRLLVMILGLGGLLSLAVDGSPVAIIHLLFWILLYTVVLAHCTRRWTPLVTLLCAVASVALLDAGYLWPMANAQAEFPRVTADSFTSVLSLIWFALLPVRGKILPANGLGHELSVFIGPVVAWALWRHRHWLSSQLPESMKKPLLAVTIVSVVMGMGNLALLHLPRWLSLYDLLQATAAGLSIDRRHRPLLGISGLTAQSARGGGTMALHCRATLQPTARAVDVGGPDPATGLSGGHSVWALGRHQHLPTGALARSVCQSARDHGFRGGGRPGFSGGVCHTDARRGGLLRPG